MVKARICKHCGSIVPEGHYYCGRCGTRYSATEGDGRRQTLFFSAMQAPGRAKLILIKGEGLDGISFHLNATQHIVGRMNCSIPFPEDEFLSPKHANFYYSDNQLHLRDESSVNGTFVQIRKEHVIRDGDVFLAGNNRFRFEVLPASEEKLDSDGTKMYVSPPRHGTFRITQILVGGVGGFSHSSANDEVVVGREGCDLSFPDDPHMSRMNSRVKKGENGYILEDLGSKNGTYVEVKEDMKLQHGDYVFAGKQLLRIEITTA